MTNITRINDKNNNVRCNNLFKHVECPVLRAWNRANVMLNLSECGSERDLELYTVQIPAEERQHVLILLQDVKVRGYDVVRKEINKKFKLNPECDIKPIKG